MSENTPMSSDDCVPPQSLAQLEPEGLATNRDELFFQAGYAAGSRHRSAQFFWPAAAASLLFVSLGLAAALAHQSGFWHSRASDSHQVATAGRVPRFGGNVEQWQLLPSPGAMPAGRLTAMGWIEAPSGDMPHPESDGNSRSAPLRPSSRLDALNIQQEG